jgi:hypothetical protein
MMITGGILKRRRAQGKENARAMRLSRNHAVAGERTRPGAVVGALANHFFEREIRFTVS